MPSLDQFCFAGIQRANASFMREACSCNSLFRGSLQRLAHAVSAFELIFALIDGRQLLRQREPSRPSLLDAGGCGEVRDAQFLFTKESMYYSSFCTVRERPW